MQVLKILHNEQLEIICSVLLLATITICGFSLGSDIGKLGVGEWSFFIIA
jgi:hypothetical protein